MQTDRPRERDRERRRREGQRGGEGEGETYIFTERERERENSGTLVLKDRSFRTTWTSLTASPCYTMNTNKHDYTPNTYISTSKQLTRAGTQNSYKMQKHRN